MLSIIIVNYNSKELLKNCVDSIYAQSMNIPFDVWIVDNNSSDDSLKAVETNYPQVNIIKNKENLGFAYANNQAILKTRADYILLLNPDTVVTDNALEKMVKFMKNNPDVGIAGCRILNEDGSLQLACRRSIPTPKVAFFRLTGLSKLFPKSKTMAQYNLTYLDPDETHEVDAVSGSFLMIRKSVIDDIGMLDERFFMYGEELDWCLRAKQNGWKVIYYPRAQITHYKGQCSKSNSRKAAFEFYRSMYLFHKKHFAPDHSLLTNYFIYFGIVLKMFSSWRSFLFSHKVGSRA